MTPETFRTLLKDAKGRSEWVIVVVCDVRGFSAFSRYNQAPDAAMFIKRLYLQLIDKYFPTASFAKPTGDGLLLVFPFTEESLGDIARTVLTGCFTCVDEFRSICTADVMINFDVPERIGFGVTRGPACCLYSGDEILDYSGHLLNLAARLTDLARPQGILVDGRFQAIPQELLSRFKEKRVFVRSLAEAEPILTFCSDHVQLPDVALSPIDEPGWLIHEEELAVATIQNAGSWLGIGLPSPALTADKIRVELLSDHPSDPGFWRVSPLTDFSYMPHDSPPGVRITLKPVLETLQKWGSSESSSVRFRLQFMAKPAKALKSSKKSGKNSPRALS